MKTYLLLIAFTCLILTANSQNATKSTLSFNYVKGLNSLHKKSLDSVYHNMKDLNYHCFNLVSEQEISFHQQPKLLKLIKARSVKIMDYYKTNQHVENQNLFVKYGGKFPTLWLHKPTSHLIASGNVALEDEGRQCFSFNSSIDNMIISENENRFYFPPNAFQTEQGITIINQNIDICIWEFVDKKSLVYAGLTTDANGEMLETAGSFYIEAKYNGEELRLIKGESYTIEMQSTKSFPDMFTYYGGNKDGLVDWTVNKNERAMFKNNTDEFDLENEVSIQIQEEYDEYGEGIIDAAYIESERAIDFYEMTAGKLGWINCDRFYEVKNTSTLAVLIDSDEPLVVRLVFRNINSVMPCYSNSNHKDQYQATGIPTGEKVLLLAYSVKDENAIFGYKEITIGENKIENISLTNLSKTRFKSAVSELLY
ncbi:MAG: hypothetical protein COA97_04800 [Flavobacteriales bacterium]|nr:MAG: hypothetical protein COA97_04800 [Flavobacteriales bacterium]